MSDILVDCTLLTDHPQDNDMYELFAYGKFTAHIELFKPNCIFSILKSNFLLIQLGSKNFLLYRRRLKQISIASKVLSMSASVCAADTKQTSNWEGGRYIPDPSISLKYSAYFMVSLRSTVS